MTIWNSAIQVIILKACRNRIVLNRLLPLQVNPELKQHFEEKGFHFVGQDVEGERMEVIELEGE